MQRTIRINGYGFHDQSSEHCQAEVQIKIDGNVLYQGPVFTPKIYVDDLDFIGPTDIQQESVTVRPGMKNFITHAVIAEWPESLMPASRQLEITAIAGNFRFTGTWSNFMPIWLLDDLNTVWSTGSANFIPCYANQESEFVYYRDSNHQVMIDGVPQLRESTNEWERLGQWHWTITQGQVFSSIMKISAGLESPVLNTDSNNQWHDDWTPYLIFRPFHDNQNPNDRS